MTWTFDLKMGTTLSGLLPGHSLDISLQCHPEKRESRALPARTLLPPVSTETAAVYGSVPHSRDPTHSIGKSRCASQNLQSQLQSTTEMIPFFTFSFCSVFLTDGWSMCVFVRLWISCPKCWTVQSLMLSAMLYSVSMILVRQGTVVMSCNIF